jgi:ABC-type branched-subunit amino acid transport system ATPase component
MRRADGIAWEEKASPGVDSCLCKDEAGPLPVVRRYSALGRVGLRPTVGARLTRTTDQARSDQALDGVRGSTGGVATAVLVVEDLTVRFGGIAALERVSFDVRQNEVVAVVGPNGAGKSTLLNVISGLVRGNASGTVLLNGLSIAGRPPAAIAQTGVGRSFQNPFLVESETVLENVLLGEHLWLKYRMADQLWRRSRVRQAEEEGRRRALEILDITGLGPVSDQRVGGLSYGTRKLIDIARAIVSAPKLLLLDEPTSGLDAAEQSAVGRVLAELHRTTEMSMLVVEHHMNVVRTIADRVLGLEGGTVLGLGTPKEVLSSEELRAMLDASQGGREVTERLTASSGESFEGKGTR